MAVGKQHQYATPLLVDRLDGSGTARALDRLPFAQRDTAHTHDERWLQELLYRFPQLLPVSEIESGFGTLVPVCLELPVQDGFVDNLYVTETGNLALAECKLWRNPEARRQVVGQIIDYAHNMSRWSYADLKSAILKGERLDNDNKLDEGPFSLFQGDSELGERDFIDAVSRNLRLGRILLLIVGDGIREGVETLAAYLQAHAGFHFELGLVEMQVFRLPAEGFLVQPRVLARTVNIERGIVRLEDGHLSVAPPEKVSAKGGVVQRTSISQEGLLETLSKTAPGVPKALKGFLEDADEFGVFVEPASKSLQVRWRGPDDVVYALGGIDEEGRLLTNSVNWKPNKIGRIELAHQYLNRVASLIGGRVRQTKTPVEWYVVKGSQKTGYDESLPEAIQILSRPGDWLEIIRWYTDELRSAIESASE